jgi:hypothetical protein
MKRLHYGEGSEFSFVEDYVRYCADWIHDADERHDILMRIVEHAATREPVFGINLHSWADSQERQHIIRQQTTVGGSTFSHTEDSLSRMVNPKRPWMFDKMHGMSAKFEWQPDKVFARCFWNNWTHNVMGFQLYGYVFDYSTFVDCAQGLGPILP